jgi:hypothetical protein
MSYRHRVAFNVDLFLTVVTESPDTPIEELEEIVKERLKHPTLVLSDAGVDVEMLEDVEGRIYPRVEEGNPERLENFSIENTEED